MCFVSSTVRFTFAAVSSPPLAAAAAVAVGAAGVLASVADAAAVAAATGFSMIFCRTMRLAVPSDNFFIKFQASILLILVQSVLFTAIISSPTLRTFDLSAAPPWKDSKTLLVSPRQYEIVRTYL